MRARESDSSPEKSRRPARDVINAVLANMRKNLEPLKYSTVVPSRYLVYLHPNEYARLEGIIEIMREQTIRALSEEIGARNRQSVMRRYVGRLLPDRRTRVENPGGDWCVEFLPNPDGDIPEGDILVDSELLLPASPELGVGERTRLISTIHSARKSQALAKIEYDDTSGHHSYDVRDSVTIGRGGATFPVDIRIVSSVDVSREHARIRRDAKTGGYFLIDLSSLGTTLNGRHVPRGYDEIDGARQDNGAETLLPDNARIGLADTVYLTFGLVRE